MIRDLFYSLGRLTRWGIVCSVFLSVVCLMILGSKMGGWFTDAQQIARASQLDTREAEVKAAEKAAQDKREAELSKREAALAGLAAKEATKVADAQLELARVKAETKAAKDVLASATKRALDAVAKAEKPQAALRVNQFGDPFEKPVVARPLPAFVPGPLDARPDPFNGPPPVVAPRPQFQTFNDAKLTDAEMCMIRRCDR